MGPANRADGGMTVAVPASKPQIDKCNACGKLFPRIAMQLCGTCSQVEEHRFALVRDFLVEHDGAGLGDISRATGVPGSDVRKFMDGGRLIQIAGSLETCTCGGVGTRCRACRAKLSTGFRELEQSMRGGTPAAGIDDDPSSRATYVRRIRRLGDAS
ncbi:MAG: flagellar protein [Thermoleophilia bacterium]|nr:flagellar protein [Thermoleophilia bacterium]